VPVLSFVRFATYAHRRNRWSVGACGEWVALAKGRDKTYASCGIWTCTAEIQFDHFLEIGENVKINCDVQLQVTVHLVLHSLDLPRGEHALGNNGPRSAGVSAVTGDFDGNHEGGDE
jgi:hypothetical protein